MPTATTSSGIFGRLRRQTIGGNNGLQKTLSRGDGQQVDSDADQQSPPQAQTEERQGLQKSRHRRNSSLLSLSSSGFRRSGSLRSHRSQLSGGGGSSNSSGSGNVPQQQQQQDTHQQRNHSSSDLLLRQQVTPTLDPLRATTTSPTPSSPPRPKSKLSFSARPFSRSLKSSEALPLFDRDADTIPDVPSIGRDKKMMALGAGGRRNTERPGFASTVSLVRDVPPSSHGGGDPSAFAATPPLGHGAQSPQLIYQQIQETAAKRISTIRYLKQVHDGDVFFFNTLHIGQNGLASMPSLQPQKLGRRAAGYFFLGYSLPLVCEMNSTSALDYLKPVITLLQEFDTYQGLAGVEGAGSLSRGRMGAMFSGMGLGKAAGKGRRASASTETFSDTASLQRVSTSMSGMTTSTEVSAATTPQPISYDFTYLLTPHMPFDPDFSTAFSALCDTLADMYANLFSLLTEAESCTVAVAEAFSKMDKAIRKILVANVVKEFEEYTRSGAKAEMAGLSKLVLGGLM